MLLSGVDGKKPQIPTTGQYATDECPWNTQFWVGFLHQISPPKALGTLRKKGRKVLRDSWDWGHLGNRDYRHNSTDGHMSSERYGRFHRAWVDLSQMCLSFWHFLICERRKSMDLNGEEVGSVWEDLEEGKA